MAARMLTIFGAGAVKRLITFRDFSRHLNWWRWPVRDWRFAHATDRWSRTKLIANLCPRKQTSTSSALLISRRHPASTVCSHTFEKVFGAILKLYLRAFSSLLYNLIQSTRNTIKSVACLYRDGTRCNRSLFRKERSLGDYRGPVALESVLVSALVTVALIIQRGQW